MVTMFVIVSLAAIGLPMLNGFVGEFLILSGAMQTTVTHHIGWTVLATTGVIFSASYMLWMIQRVFYGAPGLRPEEVKGWDLSPREHAELWPFAVLFLVMGLASPLWMRAIDTFGAPAAKHTQAALSRPERAARSGETPVLALSSQPHIIQQEAR
jgi:NADH-quinone oxidoreductase subunit M